MQTKSMFIGTATMLVLVLGLVIAQPMMALAQVNVAVTEDELINCELQTAPSDPISMNTVRNGHVVKTIHAEKEIFACNIDQGNLSAIIDVTTYIETFTNITNGDVLGTFVLVNTCAKVEDVALVLNCFNYEPTIGSNTPVGTDCSETTIDQPQEMNTVTKSNKALTVETQKEIFICQLPDGNDDGTNDDDKKVDVVLVTRIRENMTTQDVIDISTSYVRCVVKLEAAAVETCIVVDA